MVEQKQQTLLEDVGTKATSLCVAAWGSREFNLQVTDILHQLQVLVSGVSWKYTGVIPETDYRPEDHGSENFFSVLLQEFGLDAVIYRLPAGRACENGELDWFRFGDGIVNVCGCEVGADWGIAFRVGDQNFLQLRRLFAPAVVFAGSGPGDPDLCTAGGVEALRHCDVCLYDALSPKELLAELSGDAEAIYVGKRSGCHSMKQAEICALLVKLARQGKNVVRLKGGDPGIFGRLAEEVNILEEYQLSYRIILGVSSLMAATTGTGMFLTRRAVSRGFTVMTPRAARGTERVDLHNRQNLPLVFFMAVGEIPRIVAELLLEGRAPSQPAAVVFAASTEDERSCRGTLGDIAELVALEDKKLPGIFIVGDVVDYTLDGQKGAFGGRRVMVLGDESIQQEAKHRILSLSGVPVVKPLFKEVPNTETRQTFSSIRRYDWIVLASRAEVHGFFALCWDVGVDLRQIPKIIASAPDVLSALADFCLKPDLVFDQDVAGQDLVKVLQPQAHILCFQDNWPVPPLRKKMKKNGITLVSVPLYDYELLPDVSLPKFDSLICYRASALSMLLRRWGINVLRGKRVVAGNQRVTEILKSHGCQPEQVLECDAAGDEICRLAASYLVPEELVDLHEMENQG